MGYKSAAQRIGDVICNLYQARFIFWVVSSKGKKWNQLFSQPGDEALLAPLSENGKRKKHVSEGTCSLWLKMEVLSKMLLHGIPASGSVFAHIQIDAFVAFCPALPRHKKSSTIWCHTLQQAWQSSPNPYLGLGDKRKIKHGQDDSATLD